MKGTVLWSRQWLNFSAKAVQGVEMLITITRFYPVTL